MLLLFVERDICERTILSAFTLFFFSKAHHSKNLQFNDFYHQFLLHQKHQTNDLIVKIGKWLHHLWESQFALRTQLRNWMLSPVEAQIKKTIDSPLAHHKLPIPFQILKIQYQFNIRNIQSCCVCICTLFEALLTMTFCKFVDAFFRSFFFLTLYRANSMAYKFKLTNCFNLNLFHIFVWIILHVLDWIKDYLNV